MKDENEGFLPKLASKEDGIPNLRAQVRALKSGNRQLKKALRKEMALMKKHTDLSVENRALADQLYDLRQKNRHFVPDR